MIDWRTIGGYIGLICLAAVPLSFVIVALCKLPRLARWWRKYGEGFAVVAAWKLSK